MTTHRIFLAATAAAILLALPAAHAQAGAVPAPGVCVFDRDALFANSLVGKSVGAQLRKLAADSDAALKAERATFDRDVAGFRSLQATLPAEQRDQRGAELQQRAQGLDTKAATAQREIQGAEVQALQRILTETTPLIEVESKAHKCGVIFDVKAIFAFDNPPSMNITAAVIEKLDAKIKTIPVTRVASPATTTAAAKK